MQILKTGQKLAKGPLMLSHGLMYFERYVSVVISDYYFPVVR